MKERDKEKERVRERERDRQRQREREVERESSFSISGINQKYTRTKLEYIYHNTRGTAIINRELASCVCELFIKLIIYKNNI